MNEHRPPPPRTVRLFRDEDGQAVHIPVEFELPGEQVTIEKHGDSLVIRPRPVQPETFAELFAQMQTIDVEFPDVDEGLRPVDEIKL